MSRVVNCFLRGKNNQYRNRANRMSSRLVEQKKEIALRSILGRLEAIMTFACERRLYRTNNKFYGGNRRGRSANDNARFQTRLIRMEALIDSTNKMP